jgi:hypothetical protein
MLSENLNTLCMAIKNYYKWLILEIKKENIEVKNKYKKIKISKNIKKTTKEKYLKYTLHKDHALSILQSPFSNLYPA